MNFGIDQNKLDLQLNLDRIDFSSVAEATSAAVRREREVMGRGLQMATVIPPEVIASCSSREMEIKQQSQEAKNTETESLGAGGGQRTVRGVVGAGAVHDSMDPRVAYRQARAESGGTMRYTLLDALHDCETTNNWAKAYGLFESALQKALETVPVPAAAEAPGAGSTPTSAGPGSGSASSRYEVLYGMNAISPPALSSSSSLNTTGVDTPLSSAPRMDRHLTGIMRWKGFHYLSLLRLLMQCHRWKEVGHVWDVLHSIGFLQFHMDGKVANSIVSTVRRATQPPQAAGMIGVRAPEEHEERFGVGEVEDGGDDSATTNTYELNAVAKATARRMVLDVEKCIKTKSFIRLNRNNLATVQQARIAEAIRQTQEQFCMGSDDSAVAVESSNDPGPFNEQEVGELSTTPTATDAGPVAVEAGDFNGLLRQSTSHKATMQILEVMKSLSIELSGNTYANIIASLQNPLYLVENAVEDELQSNYATDGSARGEGSRRLSPEQIQASKDKYEQYKKKRVAAARGWLEKCDTAKWNAHLFNEYLYLLRGKPQAEEFARVLTIFRGNALFSDAALYSSETQESILPPQWRITPDAKTYEALLFRARYLHQWTAMWELLEEMRSEGILGTGRVYQMLIAEAKVHPPARLAKDREAIARLTIDLYSEMQKARKDVKSLDGHADVINAWSTTRRAKHLR